MGAGVVLMDRYTYNARVLPFILAVLPAASLPLLLAVQAPEWPTIGGSSTVVLALALLGAQLGRDNGRKDQARLWDSWGGEPTLRRVRHRDQIPSASRRTHLDVLFREKLGITLPSKEEEKLRPKSTDENYRQAIKVLVSHTRNNNPLLFEENVNYGFRRNLNGLKRVALVVLALCLVTHLILGAAGTVPWSWTAVIVFALFVWGAGWMWVVTDEWVRVPAEAYSEQLFQALERLPKHR